MNWFFQMIQCLFGQPERHLNEEILAHNLETQLRADILKHNLATAAMITGHNKR